MISRAIACRTQVVQHAIARVHLLPRHDRGNIRCANEAVEGGKVRLHQIVEPSQFTINARGEVGEDFTCLIGRGDVSSVDEAREGGKFAIQFDRQLQRTRRLLLNQFVLDRFRLLAEGLCRLDNRLTALVILQPLLPAFGLRADIAEHQDCIIRFSKLIAQLEE